LRLQSIPTAAMWTTATTRPWRLLSNWLTDWKSRESITWRLVQKTGLFLFHAESAESQSGVNFLTLTAIFWWSCNIL
jgi:hypothetical protein